MIIKLQIIIIIICAAMIDTVIDAVMGLVIGVVIDAVKFRGNQVACVDIAPHPAKPERGREQTKTRRAKPGAEFGAEFGAQAPIGC